MSSVKVKILKLSKKPKIRSKIPKISSKIPKISSKIPKISWKHQSQSKKTTNIQLLVRLKCNFTVGIQITFMSSIQFTIFVHYSNVSAYQIVSVVYNGPHAVIFSNKYTK